MEKRTDNPMEGRFSEVDICDWAEGPMGYYLAETKLPIKLADHQMDILRHLFTVGDDGRFPYQTILYSCPKKSGKTTLAGLVTLWFALFVDAPNEIYLAANDLEQSQARVFKDVGEACRLHPVLRKRANRLARTLEFDNGTLVTALPSDYAGAAGSRHGLTVWDELWAYSSESSRRLWDELTPVPTRTNSIRLVVTYAGFENESKLLEDLYHQGMAGEVIPELAHITNGRGNPACRRNGHLFCYWDHELKPHPGLTMTPDSYHEEQREQLRPGAFARFHMNEWASSISGFVSKEQWAACYSALAMPLVPGDQRKLVFGADASMSRDLTALVGVHVDQSSKAVHVAYVRAWKPTAHVFRAKPTIDLSETIAAEIIRLHQAGNVASVIFDPYQMHSISLDLQKAGVRMEEMTQMAQRTQADQALYDAIIGRSIKHFRHPDLDQHIANAVANETARGLRLVKEKTTRKIDLAVALSMAHHHAASSIQAEPAGELVEISPEVYRNQRWAEKRGDRYPVVVRGNDFESRRRRRIREVLRGL